MIKKVSCFLTHFGVAGWLFTDPDFTMQTKEELEALKNKKNGQSSEEEDLEVGLDNNLKQNWKEKLNIPSTKMGMSLSEKMSSFFMKKMIDPDLDEKAKKMEMLKK